MEIIHVFLFPNFSEPPKVAEASDSGRSSLLESIRAAGGIGKAGLRSAKDRKQQTKKKKEAQMSTGGGDLISDLASKLSLRRKGISGSAKPGEGGSTAGSGGGSAMEKISAMIPDPVASGMQNKPENDEDWE